MNLDQKQMLDDVLNDLNSELPDDVLMAKIHAKELNFESLSKSRITEEFLTKFAEMGVSAFNTIPLSLISKEVMIIGLKHVNSNFEPLLASDDCGYKKGVVDAIERRSLYLSSIHPEIIDKEIIGAAISNNMAHFSMGLLDDKRISSIIDDELITMAFELRSDFGFHKSTLKNISSDVLSNCVEKVPSSSLRLREYGRMDVLVNLVKSGFWFLPRTTSAKNDIRPSSIEEAISKRMKSKRQDICDLLDAYILGFPIEVVVPLLNGKTREKYMHTIYSIEELRHHIKDNAHIRGTILESDLGL